MPAHDTADRHPTGGRTDGAVAAPRRAAPERVYGAGVAGAGEADAAAGSSTG
jgi:hypothetical protein